MRHSVDFKPCPCIQIQLVFGTASDEQDKITRRGDNDDSDDNNDNNDNDGDDDDDDDYDDDDDVF